MDFNIQYPETKAVIAISISLISYYCYFYLTSSKRLNHYFVSRYPEASFYIKKILFNKIAGFTFFALIPGIIYSSVWHIDLNQFGVSINKIIENWYWVIGLPLLISLINYFSAKSPDMYYRYPQMRIKNWTVHTFLLSAFGWTIYLIGYEFLFRGILLLSCVEAFGIWPAIAINVSIYSAIHLPNGMKETLGAIPFGLIACLLMLTSGSILIPIIMHISLSVSTEFFTIRYNPEMKFIN
ncbi:MAG: CPBP family intramembrane metalloprotease [Chlorobi bacterium]|nr:CPBP family intramembrane metalloprotease [Chlorobiota bacterium]